MKTWMAGTSPAMTWKMARLLFDGMCFSCCLAQAIPAQAVLAVIGHRQAGGFFGAPARPRQAAGEFRSASGTSETARGRNF
jgi:hypothetical protein